MNINLEFFFILKILFGTYYRCVVNLFIFLRQFNEGFMACKLNTTIMFEFNGYYYFFLIVLCKSVPYFMLKKITNFV